MRRILDLKLKALKEQEELQTRLEKLRREAKETEIAGLQEQMAGLQEKMASKPSLTLMAGQSWLPPTNGRNPSSAIDVPQFANPQKQYLPSQGPHFTSNARDDCFFKSSSPKLKLSQISGDPLEWPEWSQLFQATVHAANMDDTVKMNHLKA